MNNMCTVSIIIPIYKVSQYLDACVQSACEQTYQNLEIILVDDGSPDDCPSKCDDWAKRDSRIRVIHKTNGGLSDARNAGLEAATGKYIYFLDGDDYIKPELVETAVKHMEDGADMVAFHYDKVYENGSIKKVRYHELGKYHLENDEQRFAFVSCKLLCEKIGWEAWSRMYLREIIEDYSIRFADNRAIFAEDLYFCLCYCAHSRVVVSIPDDLYCYRIREDSIMGQDGKKLNIGRMNELAKAVLEHFRAWDDCKIFTSQFPVIYDQILDHIISKAVNLEQTAISDYRRIVLSDLNDQEFFKTHMKDLSKNYRFLARAYSGGRAAEKISNMQYIIDGNAMCLKLRNWAIYRLWNVLNQSAPQAKELQLEYRLLSKKKKRIFLLGTEEFGNIGDNEINEAVVDFIQKTLPEYAICEVTASQWPAHKWLLKKYVRRKDLIVFAGGGNFGDTYPAAQNLRAEIIRQWPRNAKILFPQTIYFSDSEEGDQALQEARQLYTKENNIFLFAREQTSFAFSKENFSCESYLAPDIVLSACVKQGSKRKNQALLCLRRDVEKVMTEETAHQINRICADAGMETEWTDLQLDYHVDRTHRKAIIEDKMELWRNAKVLITDRLHGMVFAAITGTPCITFSNFNHKVRGTYEWIKYLPYIRLAETVEDVEKYIPELLAMEECCYDNTPLLPYFRKLAEVVEDYA